MEESNPLTQWPDHLHCSGNDGKKPQTQGLDHLRCSRNDGKKWRCHRGVMFGKNVCQIHYLQECHRNRHEYVPDSIKLKVRRAKERKKQKQRQTYPQAQKPLFHEEEEVEVTSQGEGLDGSWYVATIISPPKGTDDPYYLAEYHNLMEEEGSNRRLREVFHVFNIRPLPPQEEKREFKLYDEVDAYYNDGWWHGVLIKVLEEEKKRFLIFFPNTKEEIKFGEAELRIHMEWIDGIWVESQPRKNMEGMQFSERKEAEVTMDDNDFKELLAERTKKLYGSPKRQSDVWLMEDRDSDAVGRCETTGARCGSIPEWAQVLEPVRNLPANVGSRIRNCVCESLDKNPPEWARKILQHSIGGEIYKGYASGPTKRAVLSVLEDVNAEGSRQESAKERRNTETIHIPNLEKMEERLSSEEQEVEVTSEEDFKESLRALREKASKIPALEEKWKGLAAVEKWKSCFAHAISRAEDEMAWASIQLALDVLDFPLTDFKARLRKIAIEKGLCEPDNAVSAVSPLYLFPERQEVVRGIWDSAVHSAFFETFA